MTATADCGNTVTDNLRTNPSLTLSVPIVRPVPWLWTDLRIGLRDSTGYVTWGPGALCPGAELVAEASVHNAGCDVAPASVTRLNLLDDNGQVVLSADQNTPPIAAGSTTIARFAATLPAAVSGQRLTVRVCADDTMLVANQCDRRRACAEFAMPLSTGHAGPKLTLSAARPIFPGEPVPIAWRIQNFCTDLGAITARVTFQGTELYRSNAIAVGLQDVEKGEDLEIRPGTTLTPTFYRIGTKQITVEVTGTGADPGPYTATTTVTVLPEPVAATWAFTMPAQASTFDWKATYTVTGRLTNPAHATMSPTSLVLDETSNIGPAIERNASPLIGPLTPGAFGSEVWSVVQTWSWLIPGVWIPSGPQGGAFTYTVTVAMQDEFGNAYPATTSLPLTVIVRVSTKKLALATSALAAFEIATTLLALAFLALAGYYTAVAAPALFAAAGAAFGVASGAGAGALDPPVPDFDYRHIVPISLLDWPAQLGSESTLAPTIAVFALLDRTNKLEAAMTATEARLAGARIDRADDAIRLQANEYRDLRGSLLMAVEHIPDAVLAAVETAEAERVLRPPATASARKALREWSSNGLPSKLRRAARASGLSTQHLSDFEQTLRSPDFTMRPIEGPLSEISQAAANLASAVRDDADLVLHPPSRGGA